MKKLLFLVSILLSNQLSIAQCFINTPPVIPPPQGGSNQTMIPCESKNGWYLPASGEIRILYVFYKVNHTAGTDPTPSTGNTGWPSHQLPTWAQMSFFKGFMK